MSGRRRAYVPLRVTARLSGPVAVSGRPVALDALLASAKAIVEGALPPDPHEVNDMDLPLKKEPKGRFYLASFAFFEVESVEGRHVNKTNVVHEATWLGSKKRKSINVKAGHDKRWRIPMEVYHLRGDEMRWVCIGDQQEVAELLDLVRSVGKKRGVGVGRVAEWRVERIEPWGDGCPVVAPDGTPTRNLPPDWPGLGKHVALAMEPLTFPYWMREFAEMVAVPPRVELP